MSFHSKTRFPRFFVQSTTTTPSSLSSPSSLTSQVYGQQPHYDTILDHGSSDQTEPDQFPPVQFPPVHVAQLHPELCHSIPTLDGGIQSRYHYQPLEYPALVRPTTDDTSLKIYDTNHFISTPPGLTGMLRRSSTPPPGIFSLETQSGSKCDFYPNEQYNHHKLSSIETSCLPTIPALKGFSRRSCSFHSIARSERFSIIDQLIRHSPKFVDDENFNSESTDLSERRLASMRILDQRQGMAISDNNGNHTAARLIDQTLYAPLLRRAASILNNSTLRWTRLAEVSGPLGALHATLQSDLLPSSDEQGVSNLLLERRTLFKNENGPQEARRNDSNIQSSVISTLASSSITSVRLQCFHESDADPTTADLTNADETPDKLKSNLLGPESRPTSEPFDYSISSVQTEHLSSKRRSFSGYVTSSGSQRGAFNNYAKYNVVGFPKKLEQQVHHNLKFQKSNKILSDLEKQRISDSNVLSWLNPIKEPPGLRGKSSGNSSEVRTIRVDQTAAKPSIRALRRRLEKLSNRRGSLELDKIFGVFSHRLWMLSHEQLLDFEKILKIDNLVIFSILSGQHKIPPKLSANTALPLLLAFVNPKHPNLLKNHLMGSNGQHYYL